MSLLSPPVYEAGGVRAPDVRTLLRSGAAPRRLDRQGVAALLWRGSAMGARLPVAGVRRLAAPGPSTEDEPARPPRTTPEQFRAALCSARERALGRDGERPRPPAVEITAEILQRHVARMDMPSVEGLRLLSGHGIDRAEVGARELFGALPLFVDFEGMAGRVRRRPRPGGDPLDVRDQRAREVRCFCEVEAQRANALSALLPAATRAALSTTGPRPPDGIDPGTCGLALASDLLRRGALVDGPLVALEASHRSEGSLAACPFLDPAVVAAARGLDAEVRFGRAGSGGLLASDALSPRGADPLDAAARGPLAPFLDRTLVRDRLVGQGLLVPEAVETAVARFRRGDAGWTGEAILLLALLTDWVERDGLVLGDAP